MTYYSTQGGCFSVKEADFNPCSYRTVEAIDVEKLKKNAAVIRKRLKEGVKWMAVLKANGYGFGIEGLVPVLEECGVDGYAIAVWEEARVIRQCGSRKMILMMDDLAEADIGKMFEYDVTPAVYTLNIAKLLSKEAVSRGRTIRIHIKVDTGMHRIGLAPTEESIKVIQEMAALPGIEIEGIYSHFANAVDPSPEAVAKPFETFLLFTDEVKRRGVSYKMRHIMNSPALLLHLDTQLDMARIGDLLYGIRLSESTEEARHQAGFENIMNWYTRVAMVKTVKANDTIGYENAYTAPRDMKIATLPVGFADGFRFALAGKGYVMIHGQKAPIVGHICMDQCMVDVSDIEGVQRGDEVNLIGGGLTIGEMADIVGTTDDEIVCGIGQRVPRVYVRK